MKIRTIHIQDHQVNEFQPDGFLLHHRYVLQNEYVDGSRSRSYRTEFFDRRTIDCVAVIPYRRSGKTIEVGILKAFRPCMYFRSDRDLAIPEAPRKMIYESVAGSLEPGDRGPAGLMKRALDELHEETGFQVGVEQIRPLGAGFFPSHGQSTEKIYLFAADVTGLTADAAAGDGSVNEGLNEVVFVEREKLKDMCFQGLIEDPKIEIGVNRLSHVI